MSNNLDSTKKSKRVRYWITYYLPNGKQKSESLSKFDDLDKSFRDTILGHSPKGMDRHYIKPTDEMLTDAMGKYTRWLDAQVETKRKDVYHFVNQVDFLNS